MKYSVFCFEQDLTSGCPEEGVPAGQDKLELIESFDTKTEAESFVSFRPLDHVNSKCTRYTYFIMKTWSVGGPEEAQP